MDVNQNNQTVSTESHVKQTHKTTDKSEKSEEDVIRALVLEAKAKDEGNSCILIDKIQ